MSRGTVAPGLLFAETNPPRWSSMIPFMNFYWNTQLGDNNWVSMELLADNKTFVGTTDSPRKLEINLETLETSGKVNWEDEEDCVTGVSHSKRMADGTVISICYEIGFKTKGKP